MSALVAVHVSCDEPGCHIWWDSSGAATLTEARANLKGSGWLLAQPSEEVQRGRLDFCPAHASERMNARQEDE